MLNEGLNMTGDVLIETYDEYGILKDRREVKNLVVTVGKTFVAASVIKTANSPAAMTHMSVGTSTTAAAAGDTALGAEIAGSRTALSSASSSSNVVTYVCTFPAGTGTGAITEAGIFNASSGGTMLCHTVFSVVNKASTDALNITWTVTVN